MGSGLNALVSADGGKTWRNSYEGIAMVCCYKAEFSRSARDRSSCQAWTNTVW
jgi:hypothetical protein